jgi:hypothetical protein
MLIDLHVYTGSGDSGKLANIAAAAGEFGLDGILVADKEMSASAARAAASLSTDKFRVFVGVEIATRSGDVILVVPELDPFLTREEWRQLTALGKPEFDDVVALAKSHGGAVMMTQPYDREREGAPRDRIFALKGMSAVEVATDLCDPRTIRTTIEAVTAASVPGFGGSARLGRAAGRSRWATLFARPVTSQAELVAAILAGDMWAVELGAEPGAARDSRPPREDRGPRNDRGDRGGRNDRGPRNDRGDRGPRNDRGPRADRGPRPERDARPPRDEDRPAPEAAPEKAVATTPAPEPAPKAAELAAPAEKPARKPRKPRAPKAADAPAAGAAATAPAPAAAEPAAEGGDEPRRRRRRRPRRASGGDDA